MPSLHSTLCDMSTLLSIHPSSIIGSLTSAQGAASLLKSGYPWAIQLYHSSQDPTHLYLIMKLLAGGDLVTNLDQA